MATAKLSCSFVDAYGRTTKRVYGMADQILLADFVTAAEAFLTAIAAVTDLGLTRADLIIEEGNAGWTATAGSNVDAGGTFVGILYDKNGQKASHKVPDVKPALIGSDGSIAITGVVATYLAEFANGADFTLSDQEQIDTWLKGALDR